MCISSYAHNNKPVKIWDQLVVEVRDNNKTPLSHEVVCFQVLDFETSKSNSEVSKAIRGKLLFFLEKYVTSEGAVSNNVLYYQQFSTTRYQVKFDVNIYL